MSEENQLLTLLVGMGLSDVFVKNKGENLKNAIQDLREKCEPDCVIPLVHISDSYDVEQNSYAIKALGNIVLQKNITSFSTEEELISNIIESLKQVCGAA